MHHTATHINIEIDDLTYCPPAKRAFLELRDKYLTSTSRGISPTSDSENGYRNLSHIKHAENGSFHVVRWDVGKQGAFKELRYGRSKHVEAKMRDKLRTALAEATGVDLEDMPT